MLQLFTANSTSKTPQGYQTDFCPLQSALTGIKSISVSHTNPSFTIDADIRNPNAGSKDSVHADIKKIQIQTLQDQSKLSIKSAQSVLLQALMGLIEGNSSVSKVKLNLDKAISSKLLDACSSTDCAQDLEMKKSTCLRENGTEESSLPPYRRPIDMISADNFIEIEADSFFAKHPECTSIKPFAHS